MKTNIVAIGNSKGIRIPKVILKQCNIKDSVILELDKDKIIIIPEHKKARSNWEKAFKDMKDNKDDKLLIDDNVDLNIGDWEW
ncbi:MAG: AbrB/MazE/SpoVT family DNA-binding domain-containing protein [bacterium]